MSFPLSSTRSLSVQHPVPLAVAAGRRATSVAAQALSVPRIDQVLETLVLLLLLYLPLAFGGVLPISHLILSATTALMAALFVVRCAVERATPVIWSPAFAPLALFVLLIGFQLVPLPLGIVELLSPRTAAFWTAGAGLIEGAAVPDQATLSLYPQGTRRDLRILLGLVTLTVIAAHVYRDRGAFRRLLSGLGLVGLGVAAVGISHLVLGAERIYGVFESPTGYLSAAPFASYSHFSEFLNLCLGAALGALLIGAIDRSHGRPIDLRDLIPGGQQRPSDWLERLLVVSLVVGSAAVALSTSRNGLLSLVFAATATSLALHLTRRVEGIGWPMVGVATAAFVALLALGLDPIYARLSATLADPVEAYGARWDLARDTFAMATALPFAGSGLGTFGEVFPAFDQAVRGGTASNAENQYLEVLAETGFAGGLLAATFVALVVVSLVRSARNVRSRTDIAAFGLLFSLAAIAFHSLTDFGLELPAIGALAAVLCGAGIGRGARRAGNAPRARVVWGGCALVLAVVQAAGLPSAFAAHEAHGPRRVREVLHERMPAPRFQGTPEQRAWLTEATERSRELAPNDAEARFWHAWHRWTNAVGAALDGAAPGTVLTAETHPALVPVAREVLADLLSVPDVAPTFGPAWSVAGQLALFWLDEPRGAQWIQRGRELAPHHPEACLAHGMERVLAGDLEGALTALERATAVGASRGAVVNLLAGDLARPDLARRFAADQRHLLEAILGHVTRALQNPTGNDLAGSVPGSGGLTAEVLQQLEGELRAEADGLLESEAARGGAAAHVLADLARLRERQGQPSEAVSLYHRVLAKDPAHRSRYDLARLLAERGDEADAVRQLRDLLGLHPDHRGARALLQRLEEESKR